jgi:hypothetical protein
MTQFNGADPNATIDLIANDAANFAKASVNMYNTCQNAFNGFGDSRSNVQTNPFGSTGFGNANNTHPAYGYGYGDTNQIGIPNPYIQNANVGGYAGFFDPGYGMPNNTVGGFGGFY